MPRWVAVVLPFKVALFLVVLSGFCFPLMFICSSCLLLGFFSPFFCLSKGLCSFAAGFVEAANPPSFLLLSYMIKSFMKKGQKLLVTDTQKG